MALRPAVIVTVLLAKVTVLVRVEVAVKVVVPETDVSCARARRGSRAADRIVVNCMMTAKEGVCENCV